MSTPADVGACLLERLLPQLAPALPSVHHPDGLIHASSPVHGEYFMLAGIQALTSCISLVLIGVVVLLTRGCRRRTSFFRLGADSDPCFKSTALRYARPGVHSL